MPQGQPHPPPVTLIRASTSAAPRSEQFDYWREMFPGVDMTPGGEARVTGQFHGELIGMQSVSAGVAVSRTISSSNKARFNALGGEDVLLGIFESGRLGVRDEHGHMKELQSTGILYILDAGRAPEFQAEQLSNLYLTLPRSYATGLLDGDPTPRCGFRQLPRTSLGQILHDHLLAISRQFNDLGQEDADAAIQAAKSMAATLLRGMAPARRAKVQKLDHRDLVAAARQCMSDRLHDPSLTVANVSRTLGCSRARLYRAFQDLDMSVAEELRKMRLTRAAEHLRFSNRDVGDIALASGYADFSAFTRAFHRYHGLSPRDYRDAYSLKPARSAS